MGGGSSKTYEAKATPDVTVEEKDGKDGERKSEAEIIIEIDREIVSEI